jgi:hypothetical protein
MNPCSTKWRSATCKDGPPRRQQVPHFEQRWVAWMGFIGGLRKMRGIIAALKSAVHAIAKDHHPGKPAVARLASDLTVDLYFRIF